MADDKKKVAPGSDDKELEESQKPDIQPEPKPAPPPNKKEDEDEDKDENDDGGEKKEEACCK